MKDWMKNTEKRNGLCVCVSEREGEIWERRHKKSDWKKIEIKNYPK